MARQMLINGYFVAGRPIKIKDGWVTPIQVERPAKQVELMTALLSVAAWDGKTKIKDLAAKFKNRLAHAACVQRLRPAAFLGCADMAPCRRSERR